MTPAPAESALERARELVGACRCHPGFKDRNLTDPDCTWCDVGEDVAAELARLWQERDDARMMLRLPTHLVHPCIEDGGGMPRRKTLQHAFALSHDPKGEMVYLDDDGTGLPLLTPASRAALAGEQGGATS